MLPAQPEQLQDPSLAEAFRADYNTLLDSQISSAAFLEFTEHAHQQAAGSVLAASVFETVRSRQKIMGQDDAVPSGKRQLLKHAGAVAAQVEGIDQLFRDETKADEIAILTEEGIKGSLHRGLAPLMHMVVAGGSWVRHHPIENREDQEDTYYVEFSIKHGVQSPQIHHGWAGSWLQGSTSYFTARHDEGYRGRFSYMPWLSYEELAQGVSWPPSSFLPAITLGRQAVIELYAEQLEKDYREAYSHNRSTRPSFTLFREAHYLQDPAAGDMYALAEEMHLLENWQDQMIDEEAISLVTLLGQLAQGGKKMSDLNDPRLYFFRGPALANMEAEWLHLDKEQLVLRAQFHAARLGIETTVEDIKTGFAHSLSI